MNTMRKHRISALIALMLCLPLAMQAKVEHLLPKAHTLTETKGTPFALQRAVTITDANNTAALKKVFTGYGDAAIVADRNQNKLLVMMVCGRTYATTDDGTNQRLVIPTQRK